MYQYIHLEKVAQLQEQSFVRRTFGASLLLSDASLLATAMSTRRVGRGNGRLECFVGYVGRFALH
jgi:hypothetical protein